VTELKEAFDQNKDPNLSKYDDINVISSLLKLYLREAPTCLLSKEFIRKFKLLYYCFKGVKEMEY
jgi:hypothetical protein